jgi:hypothetical protein
LIFWSNFGPRRSSMGDASREPSRRLASLRAVWLGWKSTAASSSIERKPSASGWEKPSRATKTSRPQNEERRSHASFTHQLGSWNNLRRVIAKVEWHPGKLDPTRRLHRHPTCRTRPSGSPREANLGSGDPPPVRLLFLTYGCRRK